MDIPWGPTSQPISISTERSSTPQARKPSPPILLITDHGASRGAPSRGPQGFLTNLLRGRAVYDAARNRGHFSLASWEILERYSNQLAEERLSARVPQQAWDRLDWHRQQGHRLVWSPPRLRPWPKRWPGCCPWTRCTVVDPRFARSALGFRTGLERASQKRKGAGRAGRRESKRSRSQRLLWLRKHAR